MFRPHRSRDLWLCVASVHPFHCVSGGTCFLVWVMLFLWQEDKAFATCPTQAHVLPYRNMCALTSYQTAFGRGALPGSPAERAPGMAPACPGASHHRSHGDASSSSSVALRAARGNRTSSALGSRTLRMVTRSATARERLILVWARFVATSGQCDATKWVASHCLHRLPSTSSTRARTSMHPKGHRLA